MPTYEYQCGECGHQLEAFQKMSDAPLQECPECHKNSLNKLVSAAGFQLKGSGWYVTDYSKKGKAKDAEGSSADSGGAKSSEAKSTEAKTTEAKSSGSSSSSTSE